MYQYDTFDRQLVRSGSPSFASRPPAYLAGELGEEEFKPLRLMNGLYVQRFAPMLRVAIPYGVLSSAQLRMLASIARRYDRGYGHFTTRQNIQFNWPALERVPTSSPTSPRWTCTPSRPAATASATSPAIT